MKNITYNLFDECDLNINTSNDLSNKESTEEMTLDDFEVCIDDIGIHISLDIITKIVFVAEEHIYKLTVMENTVAVDKNKSKKTFRCKKCSKSYKTAIFSEAYSNMWEPRPVRFR